MRGSGAFALLSSLAVACGGSTTGASQDGKTVGDAGPPPAAVCTGGKALSNSSQGNAFCIVKSDGSLWCWGSGSCGQLGTEGGFFTATPIEIPRPRDGEGFAALSIGWGTSCALQSTGRALCWGNSLPWPEPPCSGASVMDEPEGLPSPLSLITTGYDHACALAGPSAWCWGTNTSGQLGDGTRSNRSAAASVAGLASDVVAISAGHSATCAVKTGGSAWCWGSNANGQLGDGTVEPRTTPSPVDGLTEEVLSISLGGNHGCAVKKDGSVWCWGLGVTGTLGHGTTETSHVPVRALLTVPARAVTAGGRHACALGEDGSVWCWGSNESGAVGVEIGACDDDACSVATPARVPGLPANALAITASYRSTCMLGRDGAVWCWGGNDSGQLGDGTRAARSTPDRVLVCEK